VGTLRESPLHAALKDWLTRPGDRQEEPVDGYVVDVFRDGLLLEVQTGSFSSIRRKLTHLLAHHPIRLVHPVPVAKWIVKVDSEGVQVSRRKSPRRGCSADAFSELVHLVPVLTHPSLKVELVLTHEDEVRRLGVHRRRRRLAVDHRRLVDVVGSVALSGPDSWLGLLPDGLADGFTTADLAGALRRPRRLAQQMVYTLHGVGVLDKVGKQGNAVVYARSSATR